MNNSIPTELPSLPEDAVYLGRGQQFKRCGSSFDGWILTQGNGWKRSYWAGHNPNKHYAAPAGSDIVRLNRRFHGGEEEPPKMYTIHSDGSATYHDYYLSPNQVLELVKHHEAILGSLPRTSHRVGKFRVNTIIKAFKVGCQLITPEVMEDFIRDYREGNWKRPQTFAIGQRFCNQNGEVYMLCHLGDHRIGLINIETGNVWMASRCAIDKFNKNSIPADQIPGYKPGSKFWEIFDE